MPKVIWQGGTGGGGGGLTYLGAWDANANVPALASGVGVASTFYIVSVAGNTNLDGINEWQVGDWAVFDGVVWQKIDNSENPKFFNVRILPGNGVLGNLDTYIEFTAAGTFTLPAAPFTGRTIWVKRNYVGLPYTINGNGKLIDGAATINLNFDGQALMLEYNGANWTIN